MRSGGSLRSRPEHARAVAAAFKSSAARDPDDDGEPREHGKVGRAVDAATAAKRQKRAPISADGPAVGERDAGEISARQALHRDEDVKEWWHGSDVRSSIRFAFF